MDWHYFLTRYIEKEIPTFAGFYWADDHIDKVTYLKHKFTDYHYIVGIGSTVMGFMTEGFDSISMTAMNIYPEILKELYEYMMGYKLHEAYLLREKMIKRIYDLFHCKPLIHLYSILFAIQNKKEMLNKKKNL